MDNIIIKAMTDIDERFILEAADEEHIREVFSNLTKEDGFTADDFVNTGEDEQTDGDTAEEKQTKKKITKRTHKVSFKKILLVTVISILLFAVATTVSAYVFDFNIKEELVEFFDDHIRLHLDKADSTADSYSLLGTDLAKELEENGISPVTLPAALLTEEWKINEEIVYQLSEVVSTAVIVFLKNNNQVTLNLVSYAEEKYVADINVAHPDKVEHLEINGITVLLCNANSSNPVLVYKDKFTTYNFNFKNCDYETALEIAKTIK